MPYKMIGNVIRDVTDVLQNEGIPYKISANYLYTVVVTFYITIAFFLIPENMRQYFARTQYVNFWTFRTFCQIVDDITLPMLCLCDEERVGHQSMTTRIILPLRKRLSAVNCDRAEWRTTMFIKGRLWSIPWRSKSLPLDYCPSNLPHPFFPRDATNIPFGPFLY